MCDAQSTFTETYNYSEAAEYVLFSARATWLEADAVCTSYKGRLAVVDDMRKASFVAAALADSNLSK
ncbi:hypothetical protein PR048_030691 [Dryococelus australis]|uniref:C-type lectin domain-containing protein n=1 Tax=Dryococelus australis TaxID=614101 RepID=A0ABQ9G9L9_9NEOP|nr:hypothetical protein PR048_030691 [Dryococelus australis]